MADGYRFAWRVDRAIGTMRSPMIDWYDEPPGKRSTDQIDEPISHPASNHLTENSN